MSDLKCIEIRGKEIDDLIKKNDIKLEDYDIEKIIKRLKEKWIFK